MPFTTPSSRAKARRVARRSHRDSARVGRFSGTSLTVLATLCFGAGPGLAEDYKLQSGDTLEIAVAGIPELKQRTTIDLDGRLGYPLAGTVKAAGSTLDEVTAALREALAKKVFQQRALDGREIVVGITPDAVTVNVAQFRPMYVSGDVAKPGEQAYVAGLTVQKAVALAGGYDVMRFRMNDPFLETANLRSEYQTLWTTYARERARVRFLRQELGLKTDDEATTPTVPVPQALLAEIENSEAKQSEFRLADLQREKISLRRIIQQTTDQIDVLIDRQKREEEGAQADAADFNRLNELFSRGTVPTTRLADARRIQLLSASQLLQTTSQLLQLRREREETTRKIDRLDEQRRLELLRENQEATLRIAEIRSTLQAVGEKLLYAGTVRSQLVRGKGGKPQITVTRQTNTERQRFPADEFTRLLPGDLVEVALQLEFPSIEALR